MKLETRTKIRKTAAYMAITTAALYIITGYGITEYQTVERLTAGILTKALSFKAHMWLILPFAVFLLTHLYFSCDLLCWARRIKK